MKNSSPTSGYIALVSAVIIAAVLLVITFSLSFSGFFSRFNILGMEYKKISSELAEACVDTAILRLAKDPNYTGNETLAVGSESCSIRPIGTAGSQKVIKTQAQYQKAYTNLRVTVTISGLAGSPSPSPVPPPPGSICVDTLIMLDRTTSMSSTDLANERTAAKSLLQLYSSVSPPPKVGVGRFGDSTNGGVEAEVQVRGQLTNEYGEDDAGNDSDNDLYHAIEEATGSNSSVGTNLQDAINAGQAELASLRATPGIGKVLILISDGDPNEPAATTVNTSFKSPSAEAADTGGDGNGFEVNPTNAFADGPSGLTGAAHNLDGADDRHQFWGYDFGLPATAAITGIEVRLDWWLNSTSGTNRMNVELSWDNGLSWTPQKTSSDESTSSSNSDTLGSSSDTWGRTWTVSDFESANFRVRLTTTSTGSFSSEQRDFFLDWVPVRVHYRIPGTVEAALDATDFAKVAGTTIFTIHFGDDPSGFVGQELLAAMASGSIATPSHSEHSGSDHQSGSADDKASAAAENADGDNFFIAPTSADLQDLFILIGQAACPATVIPGGGPPPSLDIDAFEELPVLP